MNDRDQSSRLVSAPVREFLLRRVEEISGVITIAIGMVMMAVLITADPADPSSNTVTSIVGAPSNILGIYGAEAAAWLININGIIAAYMLAFIPLVWGADIAASPAFWGVAPFVITAGCDTGVEFYRFGRVW